MEKPESSFWPTQYMPGFPSNSKSEAQAGGSDGERVQRSEKPLWGWGADWWVLGVLYSSCAWWAPGSLESLEDLLSRTEAEGRPSDCLLTVND